LTRGQRYPVHWELLLLSRGRWWKGGSFSYATKATSGRSAARCVAAWCQATREGLL
jgi:hypothetical protein